MIRASQPGQAVDRRSASRSPKASATAQENTATLIGRPLGWHARAPRAIDGEPISASLFDFGVLFLTRELVPTAAAPTHLLRSRAISRRALGPLLQRAECRLVAARPDPATVRSNAAAAFERRVPTSCAIIPRPNAAAGLISAASRKRARGFVFADRPGDATAPSCRLWPAIFDDFHRATRTRGGRASHSHKGRGAPRRPCEVLADRTRGERRLRWNWVAHRARPVARAVVAASAASQPKSSAARGRRCEASDLVDSRRNADHRSGLRTTHRSLQYTSCLRWAGIVPINHLWKRRTSEIRARRSLQWIRSRGATHAAASHDRALPPLLAEELRNFSDCVSRGAETTCRLAARQARLERRVRDFLTEPVRFVAAVPPPPRWKWARRSPALRRERTPRRPRRA